MLTIIYIEYWTYMDINKNRSQSLFTWQRIVSLYLALTFNMYVIIINAILFLSQEILSNSNKTKLWQANAFKIKKWTLILKKIIIISFETIVSKLINISFIWYLDLIFSVGLQTVWGQKCKMKSIIQRSHGVLFSDRTEVCINNSY